MRKRYLYMFLILLGSLCGIVMGCPNRCLCVNENGEHKVICNEGESLGNIIGALNQLTSYLEITSTTINSLSPTDLVTITAPDLTTLILRNCYINNIYDNTFEKLTKLQHLNLTQNSISTLSSNAFAGLTTLKTLDLSSNRISSLDDQLLPLIKLLTLDLGQNVLTEINSGVFRMQTNLQTLTLNGNKLEHLHGDSLKGLGYLRRLNLRYCDLTSIPNDLFTNSRILQTLDVGFNRIYSLPPSKNFIQASPYLNTLIIDGNHIEILVPHQFSGMRMSYLNLAKNRIRQIRFDTFDHFDVNKLDLSENVISSIHPNAFKQISLSLTSLNLAGNNLGVIPERCLDSLYRLQYLNVSMCALNNLDTNEFGKLQNLQVLDLSKNRIEYIPYPVLDVFKRLIQVNIEENAWHCDCHIKPFREWLFTSKVGIIHCSSTYSIECRNPKCSSPPLLAGQIISLTDSNQLVCQEEEESQPLRTSQVVGISIGCVISVTIIIAVIIICIRYSQGKIEFSCNDSQFSSTEMEEKDRSSKPFHDPDVGSLDESDKSFVVRNFFHSMVPNPEVVSRGSPEMSRKEENFSCASSLRSVGYNPMGRESAV